MNVARKFDLTDTESDKEVASTKGAEVIYLTDKKNDEDKKFTIEYLNEKLAYFYNNGGPIMEL